MITISIIWIILFLSLVLICSGLYFQKKALILVLVGGILIMLTGLLTLLDPIGYSTLTTSYNYTNLTLNSTSETITPSPINTTLNFIISWVMMIIGLACIIGSTIKLYDLKYEEEEEEELEIFR